MGSGTKVLMCDVSSPPSWCANTKGAGPGTLKISKPFCCFSVMNRVPSGICSKVNAVLPGRYQRVVDLP